MGVPESAPLPASHMYTCLGLETCHRHHYYYFAAASGPLLTAAAPPPPPAPPGLPLAITEPGRRHVSGLNLGAGGPTPRGRAASGGACCFWPAAEGCAGTSDAATPARMIVWTPRLRHQPLLRTPGGGPAASGAVKHVACTSYF